MERDKKSNLQPVVASSEAWHLGNLRGLERALEVVRASLPDAPSSSLNAFSGQLASALTDEAESSWREYLRYADRPQLNLEREAVDVTYDEARALPMIAWPGDGADTSWGLVDVEADGGPDIILAAPFRAVRLDSLPDDKVIVKLYDSYHTATAALVEILTCASRDAHNAFVAPDGRAAWRRLNTLINIYRQSALAALNTLKEDEYVGWKPTLPAEFQLDSAARLICQIAGTPRAQMALATYLTATWLQALADAAERLPAQRRRASFELRLEEARTCMEDALSGMNRTVAAAHWTTGRAFQCMVIFRPQPQSIPVLAILPAAEPATVTELPRAKVRGK